MQQSVVDMLSSTEMEELPVMVKFLLQSVADDSVIQAWKFTLMFILCCLGESSLSVDTVNLVF